MQKRIKKNQKELTLKWKIKIWLFYMISEIGKLELKLKNK